MVSVQWYRWVTVVPMSVQPLPRAEDFQRSPGGLTAMLPGHHSEADKGPSFSMCPASHCGLSPDGLEPNPTQEPVLSSWVAAHSWEHQHFLALPLQGVCIDRIKRV